MNDKAFEAQLRGTLRKLEKTTEKILKTRGYTDEVARLRLISESIKEQLVNENSGHTAR